MSVPGVDPLDKPLRLVHGSATGRALSPRIWDIGRPFVAL
jgi:hypothetical protein